MALCCKETHTLGSLKRDSVHRVFGFSLNRQGWGGEETQFPHVYWCCVFRLCSIRCSSDAYLFYSIGYPLLLEQQPHFFAVGAPSRVVPVERHARFFHAPNKTQNKKKRMRRKISQDQNSPNLRNAKKEGTSDTWGVCR